jgi:hypothetical protein
MASSLQACIGSAANGLVAGVMVPLVMHSTRLLAASSAAMMAMGLVAGCPAQTLARHGQRASRALRPRLSDGRRAAPVQAPALGSKLFSWYMLLVGACKASRLIARRQVARPWPG